MGHNMDRIKFVITKNLKADVRWYLRQGKSDLPFVLYVNGKKVCESVDYAAMNREYESYASERAFALA